MDQWHWAMLNDEKRNSVYAEAMKLAIKDDSRVLDIGGGTWFLSMIAYKFVLL